MKAKLLVMVGLVALLMVAGLVLVSCSPCNIDAGGCEVGLSSSGGLNITACTSSDCDVNKALDNYYDLSALPTCSCK